MKEKLLSIAWEVHRCIWERFVHPETNMLKTRLGEGDPLEDCSLYGGFYLACLVDAYAATREERFVAEARRIFEGLRLNATASGIPGFLARGVAEDGTYRGEPSVDQYTGFMYGCWRYFHSPLSGRTEREDIRRFFTDILSRLEANAWKITREDGTVTKFGHLDALRPTRAERLLAFLRAGYEVTGDGHWLENYRQVLAARLHHCRNYTGTPSWVGIQSQVSLQMLIALEDDPEVGKAFVEGACNLAEVCRPQMEALHQVPPGTAKQAPFPFYRSPLFTETIRNPLEAVTVLLLTEEQAFRREATATLDEIRERLDLKLLSFAWALVPWEWDLWLALRSRRPFGDW